MEAMKLKEEFEGALMSAAESMIQQLLREDKPLHGGHVHDLMRACAANLAQGFAPRTVDDAGCIGIDELARAFEEEAKALRHFNDREILE